MTLGRALGRGLRSSAVRVKDHDSVIGQATGPSGPGRSGGFGPPTRRTASEIEVDTRAPVPVYRPGSTWRSGHRAAQGAASRPGRRRASGEAAEAGPPGSGVR